MEAELQRVDCTAEACQREVAFEETLLRDHRRRYPRQYQQTLSDTLEQRVCGARRGVEVLTRCGENQGFGHATLEQRVRLLRAQMVGCQAKVAGKQQRLHPLSVRQLSRKV